MGIPRLHHRMGDPKAAAVASPSGCIRIKVMCISRKSEYKITKCCMCRKKARASRGAEEVAGDIADLRLLLWEVVGIIIKGMSLQVSGYGYEVEK